MIDDWSGNNHMTIDILNKKNCFITGATGGIGRQVALKMAEANCNLFLTSTTQNKIDRLKGEIDGIHDGRVKVRGETGDLNSITDIEKLIVTARQQLDSIDIFVHCAGFFIVKSLCDSNLKDFETSFNLNVRAVFLFCRAFSSEMIRKQWGRIITIGSSSAYAGFRNTSIYSASKHAVLGLSRAFQDELKEYNIRTYCISPAGVKTEMGRRIPNQDYNTFIDPREIAEYVMFICGFDSGMVSDEIRLNRMITQ